MRVFVTGGSGFIGCNLTEELVAGKNEVYNGDVHPPLNPTQEPFYHQCDILDANTLRKCFAEFEPDAVVHLAARTDIYHQGAIEPYYAANTVGTSNVLNAIKATPSVKRVMVASTQYVCRGGAPTGPDDYHTDTVYGASKVETEKITKAANLSCAWTIIRPTNVWGPWHAFYRDTIIRAIRKGYYFQPSGRSCVLGFGYVRNVVKQVCKLLQIDPGLANGKTLYVGDELVTLYDWANAFSLALKGRKVPKLPRSGIYAMARFGDAFKEVTGRQFIMFSARYNNMTKDFIVPMQPTFDLLGKPEIPMEQAVRETLAWIEKHPGPGF
ncbi:MAG: NAD-dependent epimerase/dehydratase family protein [Limisphaerales bacterium]